MGGEVGAGTCGCVRVGFDGYGSHVSGARDRPTQSFDAVVDVGADHVLGDIEPRWRFGVGGEVRVLADHVLFIIFVDLTLSVGDRRELVVG